jgi:hypothetical protein
MDGSAAADPVIRRNGDVLEAEVGNEMVALSVESGTCYGFNDTAYHIWRITERPMPLSQMCAALMEQFDVDAETCAADVRAMLEELAVDGLVTLTDA